jgi:hypothetical protein
MRFSTEQLNKFRQIYLDSYGINLNKQEAETEFREITDLLRTIIQIKHRNQDENIQDK